MATLPNYVKFLRGTLAAYNRLSQKDNDTLYFIYDANDNSKGSLYLGSRLIGNVGGSGGVSNLSELSDVLVSGANTGDFLVLNSEGKWTSVPASDVAEAILAGGSNFVTIDENEFLFNAVNGKLELKGYSSATSGFVPVKSTTAGLAWVSLPPDLSTTVGNLETALNSHSTAIASIYSDLLAVDGKINTAISNANHLSYEVISDLNAATAENVIYLHSNGTTATNNIYNEYMVTNGALELIGNTNVDLSGYATLQAVTSILSQVTTLESNVNTLSAAVVALQANLSNLALSVTSNYVLNSTFVAVVGDLTTVNSVLNSVTASGSITDTLIDIYDRLTWQEISE